MRPIDWLIKKFGFIIGIVLVAGLLFAAGWCLGIQRRVLSEVYAIPAIDKHVTDAAQTARFIEQIESGKAEDARHMLQLKLVGQILSVDMLLDAADARSQNLASKVFARIAEYRAEHPYSYTGQLSQLDAEMSARIDFILAHARQQKTE